MMACAMGLGLSQQLVLRGFVAVAAVYLDAVTAGERANLGNDALALGGAGAVAHGGPNVDAAGCGVDEKRVVLHGILQLEKAGSSWGRRCSGSERGRVRGLDGRE